MPLRQPFPELDALLASMGEAGSRISEIDASEAAVERMYRDARIQSIGGGATEVMLDEVAKVAAAMTDLRPEHLIQPYFVVPGEQVREPVPSLPGIDLLSIGELVNDVGQAEAARRALEEPRAQLPFELVDALRDHRRTAHGAGGAPPGR